MYLSVNVSVLFQAVIGAVLLWCDCYPWSVCLSVVAPSVLFQAAFSSQLLWSGCCLRSVYLSVVTADALVVFVVTDGALEVACD